MGAGPLVAIGLAGVVYLFAFTAARAPRWQPLARRISRASGVQVTETPGRLGGGLLAALGVPIALYVAINEIKFNTLVSIPLNHQVLSLVNGHRQAVLAANGGSLFGLKFLPTNLLQFARPDALAFTRTFPWILFPGKALVLGHVLYDTRDWTSSVPASTPVLFLLAVVGVVMVFRPIRSRPGRPTTTMEPPAAPRIAALRLPLVGAAAGTVGILTIAFIAERYLADVMPLLLLAGLAGWHGAVGRWARTPQRVRRIGVALLALLALFELWTTLSLTLFYQRELGAVVDIPQRAGMVAFQEQVAHTLLGGLAPGAEFVSRLPARAPTLGLAVVGQCAAVYQYDGNTWNAVELGAAGGAQRLEVTFPHTALGKRQPLLVTGGATPQDVVAVTWEGGDLYRFSYLFAPSLFGSPSRWVTEPAVVVSPRGPHRVQVDLDSRVHTVFITLDGTPVFSSINPVVRPTGVRLGSAPPSISTTPAFAGGIRPLPVPTPICHALEGGGVARTPNT